MHGKPTAEGADEVLQGAWPDFNEDEFGSEAQVEFAKARHIEDDILKNIHEGKQHAADHMSGELAEGIQTKLGIRVSEFADTIAAHCNTAGWLMAAQTAIATAKKAMAMACDSHEAIHKQPVKQNHGGKISAGVSQESKDADLSAKRAEVAQAKATLEGVMASVRSGISGNVAPPGGTPQIPADPNAAGVRQIGPRSDMVAKPPVGALSPENTNPALNNPAAPGSTPPASPAAPASPFSAAPAGPASPFDSPSSTPPASAPSVGAPEGAGAGAGTGGGTPAAGAGMPMSGMPMSGMPQMPQMQPPQMPTQTPGNDIAKTVGDTVGKLAGGSQGTPVSEAALNKLLERQGPSTTSGHEATAPVGEGQGPGKEGSTETKEKEGTHLLGQGPQRPSDPYSAANTNPALNNPGGHEGKPSPAAPTVTSTPSTVSAPVTELSADENVGRGGSATAVSAAGLQHQPPVGEGHTHTSANSGQQAGGQGNWNPFGSNNSNTLTPNSALPANPGPQTPGAGQTLGAYTPGGLTPPVPPPPMSSSIPSAPVPPVQVAPPVPGAATPVLGVVPAAAAIARKAVGGGKNEGTSGSVERIATLPPEHATADMHLAGLVRSFTAHEWAGTVIAVGVFVDTDPQPGRPGLRYVMATSDGLSHLPLGVPIPAGVDLLEDQKLGASFGLDWNGHWRAGVKLAAYARTHSDAGELMYLVSNDSDGILNPAKAGGVVEVVQSDAERQHLVQTGHASAAVLHRAEVSKPRVTEEEAGEYLTKLGDAWGFNDGSEESHMSAISRLWAARWDQHRDRDPEYQAVLATYLLIEGEEALRQGRLLDVAYAVTKMAMVEPPINA